MRIYGWKKPKMLKMNILFSRQVKSTLKSTAGSWLVSSDGTGAHSTRPQTDSPKDCPSASQPQAMGRWEAG